MSLVVRVADENDCGWMADIYAPIVRDTAISFELSPPSADEIRSRINDALRQHPWLVAERDKEPLGYAYASPHRARPAYRWSCDVSVYVSPKAYRQKAGTVLYARLLEILKVQGYRNAFAGIALPNAPSIALHQRAGFRPLGTYSQVGYKLGAWHDVGWWQLQLADDTGPPAEPVPFEAYRRRLGL